MIFYHVICIIYKYKCKLSVKLNVFQIHLKFYKKYNMYLFTENVFNLNLIKIISIIINIK